MIEQKRKNPLRILPIMLMVTMLLMLIGCIKEASDSDMEEWVKMKFSYYRDNDNIVLGLKILNTRDVHMHSRHTLSFLVNDKVSTYPFEINKFWLGKSMVSNAPKYKFEYTTEEKFAKLLGPGIKKMKWQYGPICTNEISIEVMDDFTIREIKIECDDYVKEIGVYYSEKKKKEAIKESPISEAKKDSDI